jgi:hypothetical protein
MVGSRVQVHHMHSPLDALTMLIDILAICGLFFPTDRPPQAFIPPSKKDMQQKMWTTPIALFQKALATAEALPSPPPMFLQRERYTHVKKELVPNLATAGRPDYKLRVSRHEESSSSRWSVCFCFLLFSFLRRTMHVTVVIVAVLQKVRSSAKARCTSGKAVTSPTNM